MDYVSRWNTAHERRTFPLKVVIASLKHVKVRDHWIGRGDDYRFFNCSIAASACLTRSVRLVMPNFLNLAVLAGFAGSMAAAAFEDCRRLIIPNALVVSLCVLWVLQVATAPDFNLAASLAAAACAAAVFAAGALLFSHGLMGGGDVKLLAAATLWAGPNTTPVLLLTTAILGGFLTLALLCWVAVRRVFASKDAILTPSRIPVPYGVAIAAAALIVTIPPHFA